MFQGAKEASSPRGRGGVGKPHWGGSQRQGRWEGPDHRTGRAENTCTRREPEKLEGEPRTLAMKRLPGSRRGKKRTEGNEKTRIFQSEGRPMVCAR